MLAINTALQGELVGADALACLPTPRRTSREQGKVAAPPGRGCDGRGGDISFGDAQCSCDLIKPCSW